MRSYPVNGSLVVLLLALFCIVFGAKVIIISSFGSAVPFWDQWDGDAAVIYLPYMEGTLSVKSLLGPHNEHRILFSRILSLGLLLTSGEWNPILAMLVNAALHSAAVVLLTWGFALGLSEKDRYALVVLSAITFAAPIGQENLLAGFQSAFYFLLFFAIASFILVIRSRALSPGWWCAVAAAVASYFSLASGIFTFLVTALIVVGQNFTRKKMETSDLLAVTILLAIGIVCIMFLNSPAGHEPLKAHNISEFMRAFVWLAGFPFSVATGLDEHIAVKFLLMFFALAPTCAVVFSILSRRPVSQSAWLSVAILTFVGLQVVSVSYSRAQGFNAPRYLDILLPGIPASFVALSLMGGGRLLRMGWAFAALGSVVYLGLSTSFPQIVAQKQLAAQQLQNVKAFLATSDVAMLQDKPFMHIPYPDPVRLASLLSTPLVRIILPAELRPTEQATENLRERLFPHAQLYGLVERIKTWLLRRGNAIFSMGIAMLFVGSLWQVGRGQPMRADKQRA